MRDILVQCNWPDCNNERLPAAGALGNITTLDNAGALGNTAHAMLKKTCDNKPPLGTTSQYNNIPAGRRIRVRTIIIVPSP